MRTCDMMIRLETWTCSATSIVCGMGWDGGRVCERERQRRENTLDHHDIKQRCWRMCVCATIKTVSLSLSSHTHNMPHTATPAKALIFYSHTPLRSTDQVPSVHELCMRGCSGQLMLEMGIDTTRRGNMIQLLGLGGCDSIQQVRQLFYPQSHNEGD